MDAKNVETANEGLRKRRCLTEDNEDVTKRLKLEEENRFSEEREELMTEGNCSNNTHLHNSPIPSKMVNIYAYTNKALKVLST